LRASVVRSFVGIYSKGWLLALFVVFGKGGM